MKASLRYGLESAVFAALGFFDYPSPWPSPARGEGIHRSGLVINWQEAFNALEKNIPSPLAGEGQGEGDKKPAPGTLTYLITQT